MVKNNYSFFINHVKLALARKSLFFDIPVSKQVFPLMQLFYNRGIVRRFYKISPTSFRVYLHFDKNPSRFYQVKNFYRASKPVYVTLQALTLFSQSSGATVLVLETNKGIVDHKQALTLKTGGRLICLIK